MVAGKFIVINNKTLEGYSECFKYIRDYIFNYIKNDYDKIKWKIFTTDFEYALFQAFKNVFFKLEFLEYKGCFFHYLKNIRKCLDKNWFIKKDNISHYNYIINRCYNLLLKQNIDKTISKEINTTGKKNKDY